VTVTKAEIGLVSADGALADFYAEVFEIERLETMDSGVGTVHRLDLPGALLKVMVPKRDPDPAPEAKAFFSFTGLRYLTFYVGGLDGILERAAARGGTVGHGPTDVGGGVRIAVLSDPDGNAIEMVELPG
jgi:predicted enzyme related to lactoylglutathione lyase